MTGDDLAVLRARFSRLVPLEDREWAMFVQHGRAKQLAAEETFARPGERDVAVGVVVEGILRIALDRVDGRSFTKSFLAEGDFVGAADALFSGGPTRLRIEALTDVRLFVLPAVAWRELMDRARSWERVGRLIAEQLYLKKVQREASLLMDPPEVRYRAFLQSSPQVASRVSDYLIASYLGIAPETLSRLRGRVRARRS